jgi:hypothetical protein
MRDIQIFILLPTVTPENDFFRDNSHLIDTDNNLIADYIGRLEAMLEITYREKNTNVFYSTTNIEQFLSTFDGDIYLQTLKGKLQEMLTGADDWETRSLQKNTHSYFIWSLNDSKVYQIINHTLAEIAESTQNQSDNRFVLIDHEATHLTTYIYIFKDSLTKEFEPFFIKISSTVSRESLEEWLINNRQQRVFNLNPKHGENGMGGHKSNKGEKVALLLCSRERAQELLNNAKGDKRKNKELYIFDDQHKRFLIFKDDNTEINSYHGYHLDSENEIPAKIRNGYDKTLKNIMNCYFTTPRI